MKKISEATGEVLKKIGIVPGEPPTGAKYPRMPIIARFMLCHSKRDRRKVTLVWIDNTGSCNHEKYEEDQKRTTLWHTYNRWDDYLKRWYLVSVRCPDSLDEDEIRRMEFEDPPGHALNRLREERTASENKVQKKQTASDLYG